MISDFLNDYQNNSIINKTKKRFYLFSNIALIVEIIFFLFLFLFKLLFNTATTILELKEKDYEPLYMYLNEILLEKKIKG